MEPQNYGSFGFRLPQSHKFYHKKTGQVAQPCRWQWGHSFQRPVLISPLWPPAAAAEASTAAKTSPLLLGPSFVHLQGAAVHFFAVEHGNSPLAIHLGLHLPGLAAVHQQARDSHRQQDRDDGDDQQQLDERVPALPRPSELGGGPMARPRMLRS